MRNFNLSLAILTVATTVTAHAEIIYNSIPGTLAGSYPSLGFQATATAEFGDRIDFGGSARSLSSATFTMVNWARLED